MSPDVAGVCLRAEHAIELGELLEFVGHWLDGAPEVFGDALVSFCGASCATIWLVSSCCWAATASGLCSEMTGEGVPGEVAVRTAVLDGAG